MHNIRGRVWRDGVVVAEDFALDQLDQWLTDPTALVWLDICEPERALLDQLAAELSLDPVAVEDAVEPRERPKATRHASHTFITCYAARLVTIGQSVPRLETGRVSVFVLPTGLITIRVRDEVDMDEVLARWSDDGMLGHGVGALVHGLLDTLVDEHFVTIESMDDALEDLEDLLFDERVPTRVIQQRVFALRKALVELRRVVLPMREVVAAVMRHRMVNGASSRELDGLFNDLYDHVLRAAEWTESLRDMVGSVFETNLSLQDAKLNTVMKKLAAWGAIIAVPTAVTGWYGQNLPYPGFSAEAGLWQSGSLIAVGTVGLFFLFRRFEWL